MGKWAKKFPCIICAPIGLKFGKVVCWMIKYFSKINLGNLSGKWVKGHKLPFSYICSDWAEIWQGGILKDNMLYKYMLGQNIKTIVSLTLNLFNYTNSTSNTNNNFKCLKIII